MQPGDHDVLVVARVAEQRRVAAISVRHSGDVLVHAAAADLQRGPDGPIRVRHVQVRPRRGSAAEHRVQVQRRGPGVGRGQRIGRLAKLRCLTLVGPGGVGKTRLAVEVARGAASLFPSGRAFADLVPVREGSVAQAVASVLGVAERPQQPLLAAVLEHLAPCQALLVLDNCEHLLAEAAVFTDRLLAACPNVRVLATSRERLAVAGEHAVLVPPSASRLQAPSTQSGPA